MARLLRRGREKAIDSAHATVVRLIVSIVFHLHFIASAKINAAVGVARTIEFDMEFEIRKFLIGGNIGTGFLIHETAIRHSPTRCFRRIIKMPTGKIVPIEWSDGLSPFGDSFATQSRGGFSSPDPSCSVRTFGCASQSFAC